MKTKLFSSVVFLAGVLFFTTGFITEASARTNVSFNFGLSGVSLSQRHCCTNYIVDPYYPYYSERVYVRPAVQVVRTPIVRERVIVREYPVCREMRDVREVREVVAGPRRVYEERISERPVRIQESIPAAAREPRYQ